MSDDITKLCAASLRTFTLKNYGIQIKSAHAHELVAAYFGYKSRAALLADTKRPISNLPLASIIVMAPDSFIDQRRQELQGLSPELPDSYKLGEGVYVPLFAGNVWTSLFPPFRGFDKLAKYMFENSDECKQAFEYYGDANMQHVTNVNINDNGVIVSMQHSPLSVGDERLLDGHTIIKLSRVAGHIGYNLRQASFATRIGYAGNKYGVQGGWA